MTMVRILIVSLISVALLLPGCGDATKSSTPASPDAPVQMGGAIQGNPLSLSAIVSTVYTDPSYAWVGLPMTSYVQGITTDGTNLYVTDHYNYTIKKLVISTGVMTTLAGSAGNSGSADSIDGTGATARFSDPRGITTDGTNLYVVDKWNYTIRKIVIATGEVTTLAGTAGVSALVNDTGSAARFGAPEGITTDGKYLYVTDASGSGGSSAIRKIEIATGTVTTLATIPWTSPGGIVGNGSLFTFLGGITTDGINLYVCDVWNSLIYKVVIATGSVSILAGSPGASDYLDGVGSAAKFQDPVDITTDGTNLYIADYWSNVIRKIVIATGTVTTVAGSAGSTRSVDGTGNFASFSYPRGITSDGSSLFVTEDKNKIRRIK